MPPVTSSPDDPCHVELEKFNECVKRYPGGLKETDCEEVKAEFRKCMKQWKASRTSQRVVFIDLVRSVHTFTWIEPFPPDCV